MFIRSMIRQKILQFIEEIASDGKPACEKSERIPHRMTTIVVNCRKKIFIPREDVQNIAEFLERTASNDGTEVVIEVSIEEVFQELNVRSPKATNLLSIR